MSILVTRDNKKVTIIEEGNHYREHYPKMFSRLVEFVKDSTTNSIETVLKTTKKKQDIVELRNWLIKVTSFLDSGKRQSVKFKERIYCVLNNITEIPRCEFCNENYVRFVSLTKGYKQSCNYKGCRLKASQKTTLKKYGVNYFLESKQAHSKIKQTVRNRYGVDNIMQVDDVKRKMLQTKLQKYGTIGFQNRETLLKAKETIKQKYGINNVMFVPEIRMKHLLSQQRIETKLKRQQTVKELYNVDNISQLPETRNKAYLTLVSKRLGIQNVSKWFDKEFWLSNFLGSNNEINLKKVCDYFNISLETARKQLWRLGIEEYRPTTSSFPEQETREIVDELYKGETLHNTKTIIPPFEIDIYIPELKLGIEYDDLFWHSIGRELIDNYDEIRRRKWNKYYKYNKADKCGVQLFTIQQHLWETKKDIIFSMLRTILGVQQNKIHARKCELVEIDPSTSYQFLSRNHLQGGVFSLYNFGLVYDGELVQVISFSPYRFKLSYGSIELVRFATKVNTLVVGGFSKLLKYAEQILKKQGYKNIVTFADRLYSTGRVYKKSGFKLVSITKPNYYYLDKYGNIYHRISFQKYKLKDKLKLYNEVLTEQENMLLNGYRILYDAGHLKFIKEL